MYLDLIENSWKLLHINNVNYTGWVKSRFIVVGMQYTEFILVFLFIDLLFTVVHIFYMNNCKPALAHPVSVLILEHIFI